MPRNSKVVCIYVVGTPPERLHRARGGYDRWFNELLESVSGVETDWIDGVDLDVRIDLDRYDGVLMTGSASSLTAPEPWMETSVELVRNCFERALPFLGVCFGHQIIGAAAGGSVVSSANGWEVGTRSVELTDAGRSDPLFDGLPAPFSANLSHSDEVLRESLPPSVRVLAHNAKAEVQALALGESVRGVQFHPEFDDEVIREILHERRDILIADAEARKNDEDHPDRLAESARPCPDGVRVVENWVRHYVKAT